MVKGRYVLLVILITGLLTPITASTFFRPVVGNPTTVEIAYDDGTAEEEGWHYGGMDAVRFTPPDTGLLTTVRIYVVSYPGYNVSIAILDQSRQPIVPAFQATPLSTAWFDVDVSAKTISVTSGVDFYIGLSMTLLYKPTIGRDKSSPDGRSWSVSEGGNWTQQTTLDYMIRAVIELRAPPSAPSKLDAYPADQFQIDLWWQDNSADESDFHIERRTGVDGAWNEIGTALGHQYSDYGDLTGNNTYYYRVRAHRHSDGMFSSYSNVDSATIGTAGWLRFPIPSLSPPNGASLSSRPVNITVRVVDYVNYQLPAESATITIWVAYVTSDYEPVCSGLSDSDGYYSCDYWPNRAGGPYNWHGTASKTGYTDGRSSARYFLYTPPLTVTMVSPPSPANGSTILSYSFLTLRVRVVNDTGIPPQPEESWVCISLDASDYCNNPDSDGYFDLPFLPESPGHTYSWNASAESSGYSMGTSPTWTFTYMPLLIVNIVSPPSPGDGSNVFSGPVTLKVSIRVSGSQGGGFQVTNATVDIFVDEIEVCSGLSEPSWGYYLCDFSPTQGRHSWYARAEKEGFTSGTSATWNFIYGSPLALLLDFESLPKDEVLMVIGDLSINPHGSKPLGVNYQIGRDMTPLGYVRGMSNNTQPSVFDTSTAIMASGRPIGDWPLIFAIGGPGINSVSYYYETTSVVEDRAPVTFSMNATHYVWTNQTDDEVLAVLRSSCNVPPGTADVFVIQILRDSDGRVIVLMYGTHYTGTWAAAEYFKFTVYPTIASWTDSYYIMQWTDTGSGSSANFMPDSGDEFSILAQGS